MAFDGEAFGEQMVEIVRGYVAAELEPLRAENKALACRVAQLEAREAIVPERGEKGDAGLDGAAGRDGLDCDMDAVRLLITEHLHAAVSMLPPAERGEPGKDGEPGTNGADCDMDAVKRLVAEEVVAAVAILPIAERGDPGRDGKDADMEVIKATLAQLVRAAVEELPPAKDGRDGEDGRDGHDPEIEVTQDGNIVEFAFTVGEIRYVSEIELPEGPVGKDGADGPPGKLDHVKAWADEVQYAGSVRTHRGGTWQALKDTAKEPPHEDWICIAEPGRDGQSLNPRRLWVADDAYYRLDIVALNGGSFVALKDDPGPCPGEGWMLLTQPGRRGEKGERGQRGETGSRGLPGAPLVSVSIDDEGVQTLTNADGSHVQCDMYPVLSRLGGR